MDYIKIRFTDDVDRLSSEFEKTFEEMFRSVNPMFTLSERTWKPQMDIYETQDEVIILAELAGVEKDNLEVEVNAKAVRIFGFRKEMPKEPKGTYRLAEIRYGKFERVLYLPSPVDTEVVSSSFSSGLLNIRMAKMQIHKTHTIPIEDG